MINHILPVIAVALEDEKPEVGTLMIWKIINRTRFQWMHLKIVSEIVTCDVHITIYHTIDTQISLSFQFFPPD